MILATSETSKQTGYIDPNKLVSYDMPEVGEGCRETFRVTVGEGDGWKAEVHFRDYGDGNWTPWFHIGVYRKTPRAIKEIIAQKYRMRAQIEGPMFAQALEDSDAHAKFVRLFDFKLLREPPDITGQRLWVHYGYVYG